jgi:6-phosphogluconolactonase (cycloisomerase 2 family)
VARSLGTAAAAAAAQRVYLGSYTGFGGKGIGTASADADSGALVVDSWFSAVAEPSWLAVSADRTMLYAVSEVVSGGHITALNVSGTGELAVLNSRPTGSAPTHVAQHPGGRHQFLSLYGEGAVAVHPIAADGSVGAATDTRPQGAGSHAHQVVVDPTGEWVLAVDLGANTVFVYAFDASTGTLTPAGAQAAAPGAGPRHLAFHPGGKHVYVVNELQSTVAVLGWSAGRLTPVATYSTLTKAATVPNYPGEVVVSKDGRYVYVSNRGANSVAVFRTSGDGAALTLRGTPGCGGDWPRHLALDPAGAHLYVANQRSGTVDWFPIDPATGLPSGQNRSVAVPSATQVLFA